MLVLRQRGFFALNKTSFVIIFSFIFCIVLISAVWFYFVGKKTQDAHEAPSAAATSDKPRGDRGNRRNSPSGLPISVTAVPVTISTVKKIQTSIGTVVPTAEVVVHSRVAGQLTQVLFEEGQWVTQGQLLARIDSRALEATLTQIQGQADRNKALLRNAEQDLERYLSLRTQSAISQQQIDSQKTLVEQYRGTVIADQGALANAKLQLSFTQIVAPIGGRIGLRNLDAGNNIAPTDAQGLAVITQTQPVNVVFTLPEDGVQELLQTQRDSDARKGSKQIFSVEAWDKSNREAIAQGEVISIDNRIDPTTGTIKLKARFANRDSRLFPNQFVNLRLDIGDNAQTTAVPTTAIQRGSQGTYVYVVVTEKTENTADLKSNKTVAIRPVQLGATDGNQVAILKGLDVGEFVVTQGVDKLRDGTKVFVSSDNPVIDSTAEPQKNPEEKKAEERHRDHKEKRQKT